VTDSLPAQLARTRRFTVGAPDEITVGPTVLFLRSGALFSHDPDQLLLDHVDEYATDGTVIACSVGGELHTVADGTVEHIATPGPISHPRPRGGRVAYLCGSALHVTGIEAPIAEEVDDFWFSPGGDQLLLARSDVSNVDTWYLTDLTDPAGPPRPIRYAAVGRPNAVISLAIVDLAGVHADVEFDLEYLVTAGWDAHGPYAVGLTRDQRTERFLAIDPDTGASTIKHEQRDRCWVQEVPGLPARTASGRLVTHLDRDGTRFLAVDGEPVSPAGLQLREVRRIEGERIVFTASAQPTETRCYAYENGVREAAEPRIRSDVEQPVLTTNRTRLILGPRELRADLYLPWGHEPGTALPVLLDPYGGPGLQRVTDEGDWRDLVSQWFAEQGFAVLVIDGAGTPGRGPDWEREIYGNAFMPVLDDQIAGLHAAAAQHPDLDLSRVGIRSWSFGGTIALLAVLRRPDVFHAAIAGAAPNDARLYHARWRERFLGQPDENPQAYDENYLLGEAPNLTKPLLLMHGLADDNVHPTHTMRMSAALLAADKPHDLMLLPGIGHAAIGSPATEAILHTQAAFLRRHLG
jgi:dipeptidyl-peptidase-4